jgi:O-antigen/teichoic acid export membrane protein
MGVSEAAIRFTMKEEHSAESVLSNCLAVLSVTSAAGLFLLLPLAFVPSLRRYLAVMYNMTVAGAAEKLLMAEAKGMGKNKAFAVSEILSAVTLLLSNVIMLVVLEKGIEGYLWSIAAASAVRTVFLSLRIRLFSLMRNGAIRKETITSILKFSLPFMPATILWWIMDSSGRYIVMWMAGASSAGIFAVAVRMSAAVNGLSAVFHQAWQLSAIRRYSIGGYEPFYKAAIRSYSTMFFFGASVIIMFAKPLMLLLDDSYGDAWRYAPLLLIAAVFFAMSGFVCANYYVCEKTHGVLWTSFIGAAVSIVSGVLLTSRVGMQGTAAAALTAFYVMWLIMTIHTGRLLGFRHEYRMTHINLAILLAETFAILRLENLLLAAVCPVLLLILNRNAVSGMAAAVGQITAKKDKNDLLY